MKINSIALFCGSSTGNNPKYAQLAYDFGKYCAEKKLVLFYGGGAIGLMGAAAQGSMENGGTVIGIAPTFFKKGLVLSDNITQMIYVQTMSERKQLLETNADAFVALPGGYGTMDELFEVITDAQLGIHHKPIALFNPNGFFDLLIAQLNHFQDEGFLRDFHRKLLIDASSLEDLFVALEQYENTNNQTWLEKIRHQ